MTTAERSCYTLVTGASSGIGRSIALTLSHRHRLILHGRDLDRLEATRGECRRPDEHLIWMHDFSTADRVQSDLEQVLELNAARVDGLVHAAGQFQVAPIRLVTTDSALKQLNTNLVSAISILAVLSKKKINDGQLRNVSFISSIATRLGTAGYGVYAASKGGLNALAKSLAVELAPAVRVNSILLGGIPTPSTRNLFDNPDVRDKLAKDYPLGIGSTEDAARLVEFLISDGARWITGQEFVVDGGRTLQ